MNAEYSILLDRLYQPFAAIDEAWATVPLSFRLELREVELQYKRISKAEGRAS